MRLPSIRKAKHVMKMLTVLSLAFMLSPVHLQAQGAASMSTTTTTTLGLMAGGIQSGSVSASPTLARLPRASLLPQTGRLPLAAKDIAPLSRALPEAALAARRSGVTPGIFKGVVTDLQPGVRIVDDQTLGRLASSMKGSIVDPAAAPEGEGILVSPEQDVAVKLQKRASGELVAFRPDFSEVVRDYHIPEQEVPLNAANLSWVAEGVSVTSKKVPAAQAMAPLGRNAPPSTRSSGAADSDAMVFTIDERARVGFDDEGVGVEISFSGTIELVAPSIYGKYTKFSGYRLVFKAGERVSLSTKAFVSLDREIKVPIQAFDIPAGLGRARLGIYLVADVKGSMRLEVVVNQGFALEAGVKGGTFFYIPTGVSDVFKLDRWFNVDSTFNGHLEGFIGVSAEAELSAFGYKILDLAAQAGLKAVVSVEGNDMDIHAGMKLYVGGKVVGKKFKLVNTYIELISERREQTGDYNIKVTDTCAYRSLVRGSIVKPTGLETSTPYTGPLSLRVVNSSGTTMVTRTVQADRNGNFTADKVALRNGDSVEILVPGSSDNWVCSTKAVFPFYDLDLAWADYLDDKISGYIGGKIPTSGMALSPSMKSLSYSGPATIYVGDIDEVDGSDLLTAQSGVIRIPVEISGGEFVKKLPPGTLKPDSIVCLLIEHAGFILDSNVERASGLTMTAVRSDGLELSLGQSGTAVPGKGNGTPAGNGSPGSGRGTPASGAGNQETWSAEKSYVIVAPLRSTSSPSGEVTLKGGIDLPHRTQPDREHRPVNYETTLEANLINPVWFYRQTVPLKSWSPPSDLQPAFGQDKSVISSRAYLATTGAWTATTEPNPKVLPTDMIGDRHFFESVSYVYRGVELGYWFKDEFCRGFDSCDVAGLFGGNPYNRDSKLSSMMRSVNIASLDGGIGALTGSLVNEDLLSGPGTQGGLMQSGAAAGAASKNGAASRTGAATRTGITASVGAVPPAFMLR